MYKNVYYDQFNIGITQNDTFYKTFEVRESKVPYDFVGKRLDLSVRGEDDVLIHTYSSVTPPIELFMVGGIITIDGVGFSNVGRFKYDIQLTDGVRSLTIAKGKIVVTPAITPNI